MRLAIAVALLCACKDDPAPVAHESATATAPARSPDPKRWRGLVRELPVIDGAKQLGAPRSAPSGELFSSWCLDTTDLATATSRVAETLRGDGWRDVTVHGTEGKHGVGAWHGDRRISIAIGSADAACSGIVAAATVVRTERLH